MVNVEFPACMVLDYRQGQKKETGNPWAFIRFLTEDDLEVWEVSAFGDDVAQTFGLEKGMRVCVRLAVRPDREGHPSFRVESVTRL